MKYDNYIGFYASLFIQAYMGMGFLHICTHVLQISNIFIFMDLDEYILTKYKGNERHRQDINSKSLIKDAIQLHIDILGYLIRFF